MSVCRLCSQPLVIELDPDDFDEGTQAAAGGSAQTVPDDLELLTCHCHFHWQCLLDEASSLANSQACPSCQTPLVTNGPSAANQAFPSSQVLTRYHNEGGIQEQLDILPFLTEEAYLSAHPQARPAHAFLNMCVEGNVYGIMSLIDDIKNPDESDDDDEADTEPPLTVSQILLYQNPLDGDKSGLHIAVSNGSHQSELVAWLLLWLASPAPIETFPAAAQEMLGSDVRECVESGADIRILRDSDGRTAAEMAAAKGLWRDMPLRAS